MLKKQYFLKYLNVASFDVEPLPLFLQTLTQAFFFSFFFLIPYLKYMYTYFYAEIFSLLSHSFLPPSSPTLLTLSTFHLFRVVLFLSVLEF